jgi:glucosamine-6-phosphate deaminase
MRLPGGPPTLTLWAAPGVRQDVAIGARIRTFGDPERLGESLADEILARYTGHGGERFLLGCPGGRSLRTTYRALASRRTDLARLVVVMMDEYVLDGAAAAPDAHYSCSGFARREIAAPLGLAPEQVWLPDPHDPAAYDERIAAAGGIALFLLASGASDGHVAFLPPGSPLDGRTSLVPLAETTRRDNLATFPAFRGLDEVPRHGVSVGLATIGAAASVRLVLHGPDKAGATARLLALDGFDPGWPASVVHACADSEIWVDAAALGSGRAGMT